MMNIIVPSRSLVFVRELSTILLNMKHRKNLKVIEDFENNKNKFKRTVDKSSRE